MDIEEAVEKLSTKQANGSIAKFLLYYLKTGDELPKMEQGPEESLYEQLEE